MHLRYARAEANMALEEPRRALEDAAAVTAARPGWFDGLDLCAKVHARLGDWKAALPLWEECHSQQPHNPAIEMALERARVEVAPPEEQQREASDAAPRSGGGDDDDDEQQPGGLLT